MPRMTCGCWSGPWMGVTPPPKCSRHRGRDWSQIWETSTPVAPSATSGDFVEMYNKARQADSIDANIASALAKAHASAAKAQRDGEAAEYDAWKMVIDGLTHTQACIAAARAARTP